MPSTSLAQKRLMTGVAKNPTFARKVGIPQSVGQEFYRADHPDEMKRQVTMSQRLRRHTTTY